MQCTWNTKNKNTVCWLAHSGQNMRKNCLVEPLTFSSRSGSSFPFFMTSTDVFDDDIILPHIYFTHMWCTSWWSYIRHLLWYEWWSTRYFRIHLSIVIIPLCHWRTCRLRNQTWNKRGGRPHRCHRRLYVRRLFGAINAFPLLEIETRLTPLLPGWKGNESCSQLAAAPSHTYGRCFTIRIVVVLKTASSSSSIPLFSICIKRLLAAVHL